jgi:hypothetical protein
VPKRPLKPAMKRSIAFSIILSLAALIIGVAFNPATSTAQDLRQDLSGAQASPRQGPPDLEALHQRLLPLFELDGVVFTDADEDTGRLVVGVRNKGIARAIEARAAALGVSPQLIDVKETQPIFQLDTLQSKEEALEGGLQIHFSNYVCSIGFPAVRQGVPGFVTASHCTNTQGGVEGTKYYQPLSSIDSTIVATETVDPPYSRGAGAGCPKARKCRYSDSSFAAAAAGVRTVQLGAIEKTTGVNTGSLTISGSFTITGDDGAAALGGSLGNGSVVNKVGRTTGWTQGTVTGTCVNTGVQGSNIVQLCQTFVSGSSQIVAGGDSGSGVFTGSTSVNLVGVLWGGSSDGKTFVYSPLSNVERELGSLTTH